MADKTLIATLGENPTGATLVHLSEFKGVQRLDVRWWYRGGDGELKPTRKGVSIHEEQIPDLAAALAKAQERLGVDDRE